MQASRGFEILTRSGFAARGLIYGLIGWFALASGRTEDGAGILDELDSGAGKLLLAAMALGFFAYAAWRFAEAWYDTEGKGSKLKGIGGRIAGAFSGLIYLGIGIAAALHVVGSSKGGGGGSSAQKGAETALSLPGGWLALAAAALVLGGAGLFQLKQAWGLKFMRNLAAGGQEKWICWLGRGGFAARGIIFLVSALFLFRAAMHERSSEAGGLAQALGSLPRSLQAAVAAGLILFGLFSIAEGYYRRIDRRIADKLTPG